MQKISQLDAWHAAANELIASFAEDLAFLNTPRATSFDYREYFQHAYEKRHSKAIAKFEVYLDPKLRFQYQRDWQRHCYGVASSGALLSPDDHELAMEHNMLLFHHYGREENHQNYDLPRLLGVKALRRILSYAESPNTSGK